LLSKQPTELSPASSHPGKKNHGNHTTAPVTVVMEIPEEFREVVLK
jgi:hypothetical protein